MVESLMTEYGTEIIPLYHALLNACGGDYAEAARRIVEGKKTTLKGFFLNFLFNFLLYFSQKRNAKEIKIWIYDIDAVALLNTS